MSSLHVDGAAETARALSASADDVKDLAAFTEVATTAADLMRGFIPVARGRARDSIRATTPARDNEAALTFGGAAAPHGFVIAKTHPSRFVEKTDRAMEARAVQILEAGLTDTLTRNGL